MTDYKLGLDYLPRPEQAKLIRAFVLAYGQRPVMTDYQSICHCPSCRARRGEPPETRPDWPACPGCGQRHPPNG